MNKIIIFFKPLVHEGALLGSGSIKPCELIISQGETGETISWGKLLYLRETRTGFEFARESPRSQLFTISSTGTNPNPNCSPNSPRSRWNWSHWSPFASIPMALRSRAPWIAPRKPDPPCYWGNSVLFLSNLWNLLYIG